MTDSVLSLSLPKELLEQLVALVTERVEGQLGGSPWLTRKEAAAHLRLSVSTLEHDRSVPSHRVGGRVLYHRAELDRWARGEA